MILPPDRLWHTLYEDSVPPLEPGQWNTHACSLHALGPLTGVTPCDCPPGADVWCQQVVLGFDVALHPAKVAALACGWPGLMVQCREGPAAV